MVYSQIYELVNDAAASFLGESAITAVDTQTLVSLGNQIIDSSDATYKEKFYEALVDRIADTWAAIRVYNRTGRSIERKPIDYGIFLQKIAYKTINATENPTYDTSSTATMYDITNQQEIVVSLFASANTYEVTGVVPDLQIRQAFTSAEKMATFISGIMINMDNTLEYQLEELDNLAVSTNIAGVLAKGTDAQKRNLLAEYLESNTSSTLTAATCLDDLDFLEFAAKQISLTTDYLTKPNVNFHVNSDIVRHTPKKDMLVEFNTSFAYTLNSKLRANTFHEELIKLPKYSEVSYWQSPGNEGFKDSDCRTIKITQKYPGDSTTTTIEQTGILAFVHDVDSVATVVDRKRSYATYIKRREVTNYSKKVDVGYAVDLSENAVVFYIADVDDTTEGE